MRKWLCLSPTCACLLELLFPLEHIRYVALVLLTSSGTCSSFTASACNQPASVTAVANACIARSQCNVNLANTAFGDPCPGNKSLLVNYMCAAPTATGESVRVVRAVVFIRQRRTKQRTCMQCHRLVLASVRSFPCTAARRGFSSQALDFQTLTLASHTADSMPHTQWSPDSDQHSCLQQWCYHAVLLCILWPAHTQLPESQGLDLR
jgi:hypothetical protein